MSRGTSPTSTSQATTHASSSDVEQTETAAAAFRERYYGRVAELSAGDLRDAIEERERIESTFTRAIYYAHLWFSTDMADSQRGALVARLTEKGATIDTQLLFFGLELAALDGRPGRRAHRERRARALAPLAADRSEVPAVHPHRAGGEDPHGEVGLRVQRLGPPVRRAPRRDQGRPRRERDRLRGSDGEALLRGSRRAAACLRGRDGRARPGSPDAHVRLQHDRRRQVDRRPPPRLRDLDLGAQPLERHHRRGRAGARRRGREPLRRRPALLHAQGTPPRARPALVLRPHGAARGRPHPCGLGRRFRARAERVRGLLDRDGRHRRALLPRELDRRASARRQAARRLLCDERAGRAPVRLHELHGRSPLGAHAGARARPRAPRLPRRAARPLQRLDAADHRRDARRSSARRSRSSGSSPTSRIHAAGSTCWPVGSRTRSRRCSVRSR